MIQVHRMHSFNVDGVKWEALFVTISRSFKLDVWASPVNDDVTELVYQGRFEVSFFDEIEGLYAQVEEFVRSKHKH